MKILFMQSNTVKAFSLILNDEMTNINISLTMSFLIQMMNYSEKSF